MYVCVCEKDQWANWCEGQRVKKSKMTPRVGGERLFTNWLDFRLKERANGIHLTNKKSDKWRFLGQVGKEKRSRANQWVEVISWLTEELPHFWLNCAEIQRIASQKLCSCNHILPKASSRWYIRKNIYIAENKESFYFPPNLCYTLIALWKNPFFAWPSILYENIDHDHWKTEL